MNYKETLEYMFTKLPMYQRTGQAAYKANLDTTLALDEYFGNPHRKFKTIHIAGTNGKGSVSHSIASVLQCSGLKVGLYTSPHLRDFRERIKINGELISENRVVEFVTKHQRIFEELTPSFFEMTVAMAFDHFEKEKVDVAVVEVGLGGRLDSTNIITPILSVITNISKDHTNLLGNDVIQIAKEKAGIIKPNVPVVIGEKQAGLIPVFKSIANLREAQLLFAEDCFEFLGSKAFSNKQVFSFREKSTNECFKLNCDLLGSYQSKNITTSLCALTELKRAGIQISEDTIYKGISEIVLQTGLLGRWQVLQESPKVVCDTGHNLAGIKEIIAQISACDYRKLHIVFGMVDDKNTEEVLELMPRDAVYYFTRASIPRALDENILAEKAKAIGIKGTVHSKVSVALDAAIANANDNDLVFVGGSTFVVAEVV